MNRQEPQDRLDEVRRSIARNAPFGDADWRLRTARRLGLEPSLHPLGRPMMGEEM